MRCVFLMLIIPAFTGLVACANYGKSIEIDRPADPSEVVVYIYRPVTQWRPKTREYPEVLVDGQTVGVLKYKRYIQLSLPPGEHDLKLTGLTEASRWSFRDSEHRLTLDHGEVAYYHLQVRFDESSNQIGSPGMDYNVYFGPVSAEDAVYELRGTEPM
jgi:hypothetical protein